MASLQMHRRSAAGCASRAAPEAYRVPCLIVQSRLAPRTRRAPACSATVRDDESKSEFQKSQKFWEGDAMRCVGAATRNKKIVFVNVQVYSGALYVEEAKCTKELGIRSRGGFFANDADFCTAMLDAACHKVLIIRLLRDVDGPMFADALNKYLVPRMQLAGEMDKLKTFSGLFQSKKLTNGTEVVLLNNVAGVLEVLVAPTAATSYSGAKPELTIPSIALCRGLFEIFLGSEPVIASGPAVWAAGAKQMLQEDEARRNVDTLKT